VATDFSSTERKGSGARSETRSTPLKWPSSIRPTEPSARATALSTRHSSAKEVRRPAWSGTGIASMPVEASCRKGSPGKAGCASLSDAPAEIVARMSRARFPCRTLSSLLPRLPILMNALL